MRCGGSYSYGADWPPRRMGGRYGMYGYIDHSATSLGAESLMRWKGIVKSGQHPDAAYRSTREAATVLGLMLPIIGIPQYFFVQTPTSYSLAVSLMLATGPMVVYGLAIAAWFRWGRQWFPLPENKQDTDNSGSLADSSAE